MFMAFLLVSSWLPAPPQIHKAQRTRLTAKQGKEIGERMNPWRLPSASRGSSREPSSTSGHCRPPWISLSLALLLLLLLLGFNFQESFFLLLNSIVYINFLCMYTLVNIIIRSTSFSISLQRSPSIVTQPIFL